MNLKPYCNVKICRTSKNKSKIISIRYSLLVKLETNSNTTINNRNYNSYPNFQYQHHAQNTNPHSYNPKIEKPQQILNNKLPYNLKWHQRNQQQQRGNINYITRGNSQLQYGTHETNNSQTRRYRTRE